MEEIRSQIENIRRQSAQGENASIGHYVPEAAFLRLLVDERVRGVIAASKIDPHLQDEVIDRVCEGARKILGILILTDRTDLLPKFIKADLLQDAKLPFTHFDLINTVLLQGIPASDFVDTQWQFIAPVFQRGTLNKRLARGTILPFEQNNRIGSCGLGPVYEITLSSDHQTLGSEFPQKLVRKGVKKSRVHKENLENLSILNCIKHPNIVELLGSYTYDGTCHNLLFPLAGHVNLKDLLSTDRELTRYSSDESILAALAGLSSAVRYLHEFKGLDLDRIGCHHHLQPQNILVSQNGFLLADFGLSTLKPSSEHPGAICKTRTDDYVAPECESWNNEYKSNIMRRASDIWSFGCILAEVLTWVALGCGGVKGFREARKHTRSSYTYFSFHQGSEKNSPGVDKWLSELKAFSTSKFTFISQLVRRMLSLNPSERPQARHVEYFFRFTTLAEAANVVNGQLRKLTNMAQNIDLSLESLRFSAWRYAIGLLDTDDDEDISDGHWRWNKNILDQFENVLQILDRTQHDLGSKLAQNRGVENLDLSQLSELSDELYLFLNEKQKQALQGYFNLTLSEKGHALYGLLPDGTGSSISLTDEIRVRISLAHIQRLLNDNPDPKPRITRIEPHTIRNLRRFGDHHLATHQEGKESRPIWVEWRNYQSDGCDEDVVAQLLRRAVILAKLLSQERPDAFRALLCNGFFHDKEKFAFGMVFEVPRVSRAETDANPIHLRQVMKATEKDIDHPDLDDRFKLASTLATALFEFHALGWLHKSLTAENIIFFQDKKVPMSQLITSPWLVGLSHCRPHDPFGLTSGLSDSAARMYHHPLFIEKGKDFRVEFDYYSLGIILIEIGYWTSFSQMTEKWTGSPEDRRQRLIKTQIPRLSKIMGRSYAHIVRFCIGCELDGPESGPCSNEARLQFLQNVVVPLRCFCD